MNSKQKKIQYLKQISYYYPFHIEIKIISGENIIEYLKKRLKLIYTFNTNTRKSIKYGLNRINKYINKNKTENEIIVFIFYKESFTTFYDLLILKNQVNKNIKIFFLDEDYNKDFIDIFSIKSCMAFCVLKNQNNEKVFNEIESKITQYAIPKTFAKIDEKKD
jgi:hypothetical protein